MKKGKFITFEGIDGCGKTTQAKRLAMHLKRMGIPILFTLEPGGTQLGLKIRKILLDPKNKDMSLLTELFLYLADRAQHLEEIIIPSLKKGLWVISDRFYDATLAYQGYGRGMELSFIESLNKKICDQIKPDLTFLLDCPTDTAIKRAFNRKIKKDQIRFEQEKLDFHEKVRSGYLSLAMKNKDRIIIIDATKNIDKIEKDILKIVKSLL